MSNRYSLSQTDSPRTAYRVIDHSRDDEPALHPATLPSGAPHPLAGKPVSVVSSPSPARYRVQGEGRARTWGELGGYAVAIVEQVPAWAAAPASVVLREDPHAFDGIPEELLAGNGLSIRTWFAVPVSWDAVPVKRRPAPDSRARVVHPTQIRRWQDRYAMAAAHAPSARLALERLQGVL
jgi:hypothetical protein